MAAVNRHVITSFRQSTKPLKPSPTGKTAFCWSWRPEQENLYRIPDHLAPVEIKNKKRILFLADRNILVDQTKNNDFQPFGTAMTKVSGRTIDPAYEIHLALYQAITGPEEDQKRLNKSHQISSI